jgi:hypothetical protein
MVRDFLAMQLAVASHYGDPQVHSLVRRLWSAARGARRIPSEVENEIQGCIQELWSVAYAPVADRDAQLRAVTMRVEDVFVTLALLEPP